MESTVGFAGGRMAAGSPSPGRPVVRALHWSHLSSFEASEASEALGPYLLLLTVWQASLNPSRQMP